MTKSRSLLIILQILLILFCRLIVKGQQGNIVLTREILGRYNILIYNDSSIIQQFAAQELQHYIEAIFQVKLLVISKDQLTPNKNYFFLGQGFLEDSILNVDSLGKDAFVKAFQNGNIFLGGKDDLNAVSIKQNFYQKAEKAHFGTLNAVFDFLEDEIGAHWFFPTYLGEFVPFLDTIILNEDIKVVIPAFTERTFGKTLYYEEDTIMFWMLRNKVTYLHDHKLFGHNWNRIISPEEYFETHPYIFAEYKGKRRKYSSNNRPANLCTSSDSTIQIFTNLALNYLETNPNENKFSFSPNDNQEFCECSSCQNLDHESRSNNYFNSKSYRIFNFYKRIYDSICKYHSGVNFGGFAYKQYSYSNIKVKLPDDFHIRLAINNIGFSNSDCSDVGLLSDIIKSWKDHNNTGFFCFPYGNKWVYPALRTELFKFLINDLKENNINKTLFYFFPDWYNQGLDIWLLTKLMWNPKINTDSLKNIYYESVFPVSKQYVSAFHEHIITRMANLNTCVSDFKLPNNSQIKSIFLELFNQTLYNFQTEIEECFDNKYVDEKERRNLQNLDRLVTFLIFEHKYYKQNLIFYKIPSKQEKMEFKSLISEMQLSLCLNYKSKYFDSKISPSLFLRE